MVCVRNLKNQAGKQKKMWSPHLKVTSEKQKFVLCTSISVLMEKHLSPYFLFHKIGDEDKCIIRVYTYAYAPRISVKLYT